MHGIYYNEKDDEIVVPVALGGAILTLPGNANGGAPRPAVIGLSNDCRGGAAMLAWEQDDATPRA